MANGAERLTQAIRGLIAEKRLKQAEVARLAGMSPQQLNDTLSGVDAKFSTIEKIARALEVPTFYLLMSPDERAIWDKKTQQPSVDLTAIERRLAALEAAKPSVETEESLRHPPERLSDEEFAVLLNEGEKTLQELQSLIDAPPLKKYERKKGNG